MGALAAVLLLVLVGVANGRKAPGGSIPVLTGSPNACLDLAGSEGWCGDRGQADNAKLYSPEAVAALPAGGFLIADTDNNVVREVGPSGVISTVAGVGFAGFSGDRGLAAAAQLNNPSGVAVLPDGGYLIADTGNHRVREVHPNGRISTIAGTGADASKGDGGRATRAALEAPQGLAVGPDGSIYIADPVANRVRVITPSGDIETLAGTGTAGFSGDGGPAATAQLDYPTGVAVQPDGTVLIADDANYRVRSVAPDGIITTVAGGGGGAMGAGTTGGTNLATQLQLNGPTGVASMPDGSFVIADGPVVERVWTDGTAAVVAGTGKPVYDASSGPATSTGLADATGVAAEPDGSILIADDNTNRVREVDATGMLTTVAGSGTSQLLVSVGSSACPNPHSALPWYAIEVVPFIGNPTSPAGQPIKVMFSTSIRAEIFIRVSRHGRVVARTHGTFGSGTHTVRLARPPAPGSYDLSVTGTTELNRRMLHNCADTFLNVVHHG